MNTGFWVQGSHIYGPIGYTQFYVQNDHVYGPNGYTQYYLSNTHIYGPRGYTQYWIQDGHIYGPRRGCRGSSAAQRCLPSRSARRVFVVDGQQLVPCAPSCPRHVDNIELYMPSSRSIASRAPRSPLARQASAFFTIRSFSAALNTRLARRGFVSTAAPLAPSARRRSLTFGRGFTNWDLGWLRQGLGSILRPSALTFPEGAVSDDVGTGGPRARNRVREHPVLGIAGS